MQNYINLAILKNSQADFINDIPSEYLIKNTSKRVLNLIISTASLSHEWLNRNKVSRSDWD